MTLTMDDYIRQVIRSMPGATPQRADIERELRSDITERIQHGQTLEDVLGQLGDPAALAEAYLAEVPLTPASFGARAAAKVVDFAIVGVGTLPIAWLVNQLVNIPFLWLTCWLLGLAMFFGAYTAILEWRSGQTIGKRLFGLRVVRESGARISLGQALVRQLPQWLQVFWIDVLFALFTDRRQRAFEMLSKTRTVLEGERVKR